MAEAPLLCSTLVALPISRPARVIASFSSNEDRDTALGFSPFARQDQLADLAT
jgi:hypothetical protein